MDNERRMKVLLTVMDRPGARVEKHHDAGDRFDCLARHFNGAGLLEVTHHKNNEPGHTTYRFSRYGELAGVFRTTPDGEDALLFDRDSGLRGSQCVESMAASMLGKLAQTITPSGEAGYYL